VSINCSSVFIFSLSLLFQSLSGHQHVLLRVISPVAPTFANMWESEISPFPPGQSVPSQCAPVLVVVAQQLHCLPCAQPKFAVRKVVADLQTRCCALNFSQRLDRPALDDVRHERLKAIIRHLVTDGRKVIRSTIESLQVKDSLKVRLTAQKTNDNVSDIGNGQGSWCYVITYDAKNNMDRVRPEAEPDERPLLPGEVA